MSSGQMGKAYAANDEQRQMDERGRREQAMNTGGLSRARLARMHDVMTGSVERGEAPGLVTLVSQRGEVHVDAIGMKAIADPAPIRRDTIFRISSISTVSERMRVIKSPGITLLKFRGVNSGQANSNVR